MKISTAVLCILIIHKEIKLQIILLHAQSKIQL